MIQMQSLVKVADNSGAKKLRCIQLKGGSSGKYGNVGDIITASVIEAVPDSDIKKKSKVRAVIVRTKKGIKRKDGSTIRFDENAAVLINEAREPVGTRVFGPVARELRDKRFMKIISLAPEVL